MNFKTLVSLFVFTFSALTAHADTHGPDFASLVELIKSGTKGLQETRVYERESNLDELSDATHERLDEIAKSQAGIWADTILEGDYFADGSTELDSVVAYVRAGEVVAYRITYSERAWDTSACSFDGEDLETLFGCVQGRIIESSFVSPGLTSFTRDMEDLASFNE
ncbi:MAG: hypothetical protein V4760_12740 [Bdellovibrionota bacterium]